MPDSGLRWIWVVVRNCVALAFCACRNSEPSCSLYIRGLSDQFPDRMQMEDDWLYRTRLVSPDAVVIKLWNRSLSCKCPDALAHTVLQGKIVSDSKAHDDEIRFQHWTADLQSKDERRTEAALLEIRARLLRFALALDQEKTSAAKKAGDRSTVGELSRADQLACHIAQHFAEPLTADQIAQAVGLHPNYAMNVFRKAFGMTITQFVVQHRLYNAQRLLVTTEDPILDLASGFQSVSRFNEVFKQAFHCTPRDYRKAHR